MRHQRYIAALLLLTFPAAAFGQVSTDAKQLERMRARLSEPSLLERWDPSREMDGLSIQIGSCDDARSEGRRDAGDQHSAKWWWLSTAAGFFLPLIGIGVATGIAALSHPEPKAIPAAVNALCYRDAYGDRAKTRNILTALGSSTVGTVLFILAVAASGGFAVFPAAP
jgi:hypothetical protein